MKIALCNEVVRDIDFAAQCRLAAALGYDGIELAPFTLSKEPHRISGEERSTYRRIAEESGLRITGLHWLLLTPEGLSITSPEPRTRERTLGVMKGLVELCADLGGKVLIHGSPKQRNIQTGDDPEEAWKRAADLFSEVALAAQKAEVTYCIEPLTQAETNFINSLKEAVKMVEEIGNPHFRTMLDTKAARGAESDPVPVLIDRWLPAGMLAHVHFNDRNLRGPGQGEDRFAPILEKLLQRGYEGVIGIEPFDYHPDGPTCAARAIGYVRGILDSLNATRRGGSTR